MADQVARFGSLAGSAGMTNAEVMPDGPIVEPLIEIQHKQIDVVMACSEKANLILRLLTDSENALPKGDNPKSVIDEAHMVLYNLNNLACILEKIQNAIT